MSSSFTFLSDPGHGWLLVKRAEFEQTGLTSNFISSCSFISQSETIALEEDCDAPFFLGIWEQLFGRPTIEELTTEHTGIRHWSCFGTHSEEGPPDEEVAKIALRMTAMAMERSEQEVTRLMAPSNWGSVSDMIAREFRKPYKGYVPSCGMNYAAEAVIAEVFDAIALLMRDPRRAVRWNSG